MDVNKAEYNAFCGGVQALEDVLIDALRPEADSGKNLRSLRGNEVEPDFRDPAMFRSLVDSVNHPAALVQTRAMEVEKQS
jgi:hypothetical protein